VLRLVHSGFGRDAKWDQEYEGTNRGWEFELSSLRHYLERHPGRSRSAFWLRQPVTIDRREVWERLTRPGHLIEEGRLEGVRAGERYRVRLVTGETIEGKVLLNMPPSEFGGTAEGFGDGLFRVGFESCAGGPEAILWLSTWDYPASKLAAIEASWKDKLRKLFPES
jgi:hypothetical protein